MSFTPSTRSQLITRRTYSRPLEDGSLETWPQIVTRVIGHQQWLWERALGRSLAPSELAELEALKLLMLDYKVFPSGRTLWMGGTETIKRRESASFNCLGKETRFITSSGVKSFHDFKDGDTTTVLTHKGRWRNAVVRNHGSQPLNTIVFARGRSVQRVRATSDHRWLLHKGKETTSLALKDRLWAPSDAFNAWAYESAQPDERLYWAYGYVYGDGTIVRNLDKEPTASMVRLCKKDERFISRFEELGFSSSRPLSCNGDPFAYTGKYLKTLPDPKKDDPRLIRAFVRGYLDADGAKNPNYYARGGSPFNSIQATAPEAQDFIRNIFPVAGVYVISERSAPEETNFGPRSGPTINFGLVSSLGCATNSNYSVTAIEPSAVEDVWCLEVEEDHSFTLANGIVTGNCTFLRIATIHDMVDAFWLLLQGAGVGFSPIVGALSGFTKAVTVEVVPSKGSLENGRETNKAHVSGDTYYLSVGDSAEAWTKAVGKLLAMKAKVSKVVLDFSEIRAPGIRLKGYGWISSGYEPFAKALTAICNILSKRHGQLLTKIDILDVMNWLGTTLSSRRSAEIALVDFGDPEWRPFASAKKDHWISNPQRSQSNNSLVMRHKPSRGDLYDIFGLIEDGGGSEPGFVNAEAALRRAPWWAGTNPCGEINLADRSPCNLTDVDIAKFKNDFSGLLKALYIVGRANYRQTCVNLKDGILQASWHETNEFLRLCGVGITGIVRWLSGDHGEDRAKLLRMREAATKGAYSMADDLDLPRPKAVTTVKPSGTLSKIADTSEGAHRPLGRYIFNNVRFSINDPSLPLLDASGYNIFDDPYDSTTKLVTFPVEWEDVGFDVVHGKHVNLESAVDQLERYRLLMDAYVQHNCSITVSYSPNEVPQIVQWLDSNWDDFVGVSFLYRADPTKTAQDLGYPYLPQEVVDKHAFKEYASGLLPVTLPEYQDSDDLVFADGCAGGVCPIR